MILITGDIHGSHDIHKLSNKGNPDFKDIFTGKDGMFLNFHKICGGEAGLMTDLSPPSLLTAITRISTS